MNKKLLIILLVGLVLMAGFTFVYAKHISKEAKPYKAPAYRGETRSLDEPVNLTQRIRTGTLSEKPKSLEDLKTKALNAGKPYIVPEDQMKADFSDVELTKIVTPSGILDEGSLTECRIYIHNLPCCYYQPWPDYFDQYMNCVGLAEYWQYQDPQKYPASSLCGYPVYPMQVTAVGMHIYTPAPCSLDMQFAVTWDYGTAAGWGYPFPFYPAPDWSSGTVTIFLTEAGHWYINYPVTDGPCYHVPFFAMAIIENTDDFQDSDDPVYCPDTRYGFWITGVYDGGSVRHEGYYYSDAYGGYYDIVDIKGGNMRIRADALTRDQNECELESLWYHKASFGEWECAEPVRPDLELCIVDITGDPPETTWGSYYLVEPVNYGYAPDGMPDFHQSEPNWCGPAALSNCLWWCFAGGFPWYIITNWYGAWDPSIPPTMIAELATCMNTGPNGTSVYDMQDCILSLNTTKGFWLTETTIVQPTFEDIEYNIRISQDVILLLGYWYFDEELQQWFRLGGHYVTCSGVNWEFFLLSISDPWMNGWCDGLIFDGDSSGGVFIPHNHPCDPPCHYDAGNVSHDYYQVMLESPSPGGIISIMYEWYDPLFYNMNFTPELEPFLAPTPTTQYPVHTEIEYAVVICPGRPFVIDNKDSWNMYFMTSNYGEEGLEVANWMDDVSNDGFEGTVLLGTNGDDMAMGLTAIGEDIRFFPRTKLECYYEYYDDIDIEKCEATYYHNVSGHQLPLDVEMLGIGLDPAEGSLNGNPLGDVVIEKFVITNTDTLTTLTDLEWAIFFDFDVNLPDPNTSYGGGDSLHNTMWAYDSTFEDEVLYVTLAPTTPGKTAPTMEIGDQNTYLYPYVPGGPYDDLDSVINRNFWSVPDKVPANTDTFDYSYLMSSEKFSLAPGEKILQEYLFWYDWQIPSTDPTAYRCKLYKLLRAAGFYRGDVGDFATGAGSPGKCDIADVNYLVDYVLRGPKPAPQPFVDQGDVNCDGIPDIVDIVQLFNYVVKWYGAPNWPDSWPIDKNRFFDTDYQILFSRTSLFVDPQWQNLGLGCPLD